MVTSLSAGYNAACQRDTDPKHAIKPKITLISETSPVLSVLLKNILSCGVLPSPAKSACIAGGLTCTSVSPFLVIEYQKPPALSRAILPDFTGDFLCIKTKLSEEMGKYQDNIDKRKVKII